MTKTIRAPIVAAFTFIIIFDGKTLRSFLKRNNELTGVRIVLMATATLKDGTAVWAYPIFLGLGVGCALTCMVVAASSAHRQP